MWITKKYFLKKIFCALVAGECELQQISYVSAVTSRERADTPSIAEKRKTRLTEANGSFADIRCASAPPRRTETLTFSSIHKCG